MTMKVLIGSFLFVIGFLFWLVSSHLDNPNLIPLLIGMPIFVIGGLLAVFGKDLFKKTEVKK
jgi:hypothetical protein